MNVPGAILIDISSEEDPTLEKSFLEDLGHPVVVCHGPAHATLCPILARSGCDVAESAHGIIFELDLDRPQHRAILRRYQEVVVEDVAIRAVVKPGQADRYADHLGGVVVWEGRPSAAELDGFAAEVEAYDRISD